MDEEIPASLEHPLPAGLRDLLPEEAAMRRTIARTLLERFALHGYRVVIPPAFELADVVERGLGRLTADDVLRFIEPESGEVVVLRPDMTPQIARIVATRLRDQPAPYRLAYEGTVMRRRLGRAKKDRQIPQVGVELCGVAGEAGDLELLGIVADGVRATGLARFTIELADAGIVRALLSGTPPETASRVTAALARKDEPRLAEAIAGLPYAAELRALVRLHGGRDALAEAARILRGTRAEGPSTRLLAVWDAAAARGLGVHLAADAGEVRGLAYYTGTIWSLYAAGPGDAFGGGGRYDELLAGFGRAMPAAGFGIDVDALAVALAAAGAMPSPLRGILVAGEGAPARAAALRDLGVTAAVHDGGDAARGYARAWGFTLVWEGDVVEVVSTGARTPTPPDTIAGARAVLHVLENVPRGV